MPVEAGYELREQVFGAGQDLPEAARVGRSSLERDGKPVGGSCVMQSARQEGPATTAGDGFSCLRFSKCLIRRTSLKPEVVQFQSQGLFGCPLFCHRAPRCRPRWDLTTLYSRTANHHAQWKPIAGVSSPGDGASPASEERTRVRSPVVHPSPTKLMLARWLAKPHLSRVSQLNGAPVRSDGCTTREMASEVRFPTSQITRCECRKAGLGHLAQLSGVMAGLPSSRPDDF